MSLFSAFLLAVLLPSAPRVESDGAGVYRFFSSESDVPFASWSCPSGLVARVRTDEGSPFVFIDLAPQVEAAERTVEAMPAGDIRLRPFVCEPKVQGTGGLTAVDGHTGSFAYAAVAEPTSRRGVVVAWLTNLKASGIVKTGFDATGRVVVTPVADYGRLRVPAAATTPSDTLVVGAFDDCRLGLEAYADAIAARFAIRLPRQIAGYTSWYSDKYGYSDRRQFPAGCGAGTEASTRELADCVAEKLKPWGFDFIQLDDQWQEGIENINGPARNFTRCNPKGPYPNGFEATTAHLSEKGLFSGLWFMPFAGVRGDPWWADKAELFVSDARKGRPFDTVWGGTCLDFTRAGSHAYLADLVTRFTRDWGFRYLKFDGMFTGHACDLLRGSTWKEDGYGSAVYADPTVTGVENFRRACETMRRAAGPDTFLLACNIAQNARSLAASYGLVDGMRIGGDNGPIDLYPERYLAGPMSATPRYFYNGRVWYNDPDPVYVRASVPLARARKIASWTALAGALYTFSDWVPDLPEERLEILRRTLAPHGIGTARPVDYFEHEIANGWRLEKDGVVVFGLFNWDAEHTLAVDWPAAYADLDAEKTYVAYDFWNDCLLPPFKGRLRATVAPDDGRILAVRERLARPMVISTSRHVASPAFDVTDERWDPTRRVLSGVSRVVPGERYELRIVTADGTLVRRVFHPTSTKLNWEVEL